MGAEAIGGEAGGRAGQGRGAGRAEKAERNRSAQWGLERRSERGRTPPGWSGVGKLRDGRVPRSGGRRVTPLYKRLHFPGTEDIANYVHVSSSPLRTASLGNCRVSSFRYGVSGSAWHCLASVEGATSWSEQRRPAHKVTASDSFRIKLAKPWSQKAQNSSIFPAS